MSRSAISKYAYYVHYYASNYVKHEKKISGNELSNYAMSRVAAKASKLPSKISRNVKQEYANTISAMMGRNVTGDTKFDSKDYNMIIEALSEWFDEELNPKNGESKIIPKIEKYSGRVLNMAPQGDRMLTTRGDILQKQFLTKAQLGELNKYINNLTKEIELIKAKGTTLPKNIADLQAELKRVQGILLTIWDDSKAKSLGAWSKEYFGESSKQKFFGSNDPTKRIRVDPSQVDLNALNKMIKACKIKDVILKTAQGDLGERVAALAADVVTGIGVKKSNEAIREQLQNKVVGSKQPAIRYDLTGFRDMDKYVKFLLEDKDYKINGGSTLISKRGSQQKIDILINLPEEPNSKSFKQVTGSVKSVDLRNDIGIVSGTNLWYLIQDEDKRAFLRPFLNIMASHNESLAKAYQKGPSYRDKETAAYQYIKSFRDDAYAAVKLIAAYKALSGDTFGRKAAQLFIVNDVHGQKTYVLEIYDIINAILNQLKTDKYSLDKYFSFPSMNLKYLELDNPWEMTIERRMGKIIQDAHEKKIHASLRNIVLTSDLLKNVKIIG